MYDTARRVALVKQRVRENTRRRQRRGIYGLSAMCMLLFAVLMQAAGTVVGPGQPEAWGVFGAMLLREDAGGYVLVAVVSFAAAVVDHRAVLPAQKQRKSEKRRDGQAHPTRTGGEKPMKKRILSILLCLCMAACMLPTVAFAAGAENDKAIQLVDSGTAANISGGQNDNIYFGTWDEEPIKWRVLDDQTNTGESGLFLLSDALLGTGRYGDVYFDNSGNTSNAWQSSTAKTWCNNFYGSSFSNGEQGAVLATTKSDEALSTGGISFAASENILNGDKVFFLSAAEAENSAYGFTDDNARIANYGNSAGVWWLRSPYAIFTTYAGVVFGNGPVYAYVVSGVWAARPAFNLNLNSVLFTSAAVDGKPDGGLTAVPKYSGNEWKLTLLDNSRNFAVTEKTVSGDTITFSYSNAQTGTNEYISVIIKDNGEITHYGRILHLGGTTGGASGTASLTLPAGITLDNDTKLYVFNEQYNGDKKTDYASDFTDIALTVENQPDEQFSLAPGGRYYFDLSAMNIPGTANGTLPDSTLHYVPFTYAGTVDAYRLTSEMATTEEYAKQNKYPHSLFVADYVVTHMM